MAVEARMVEKTEIAVKLLALGSEIHFVMKVTGLRKKVVEGLRVPNEVGGAKNSEGFPHRGTQTGAWAQLNKIEKVCGN